MTILQPTYAKSSSRGFSLLEIVIVLVIAAVVLAAAAVMIGTPRAEKALREEHAKIEDLVRQGRALAVTYQQPFVVELRKGEAHLRPFANPEQTPEYYDDGQPATSLKPLSEMNWPRIEMISEEYEMAVRRWGQQNAIVLENRDPQLWMLEPEGLCEPISIRLSKNFGDISLARVYHPLTGMAEDEKLRIKTSR